MTNPRYKKVEIIYLNEGGKGDSQILRPLSGIQELRKITSAYAKSKKNPPKQIRLVRKTYTVNMNGTVDPASLSQQDKVINGYPVVSVDETKELSFICPYRWYAKDVENFLKDKYGSKLNFNPTAEQRKHPMIFNVMSASTNFVVFGTLDENNPAHQVLDGRLRNIKTGEPSQEVKTFMQKSTHKTRIG